MKAEEELINTYLGSEGVYRKKITELSIEELSWLLFDFLCDNDIRECDTYDELVKEILYQLYSEDEGNFYFKILKYRTLEEKIKIIDDYTNNNYQNLRLCRGGLKIFWQVEAEILYKRGYPKIKDILNSLFEWLQDLNWPGSDTIINLLMEVPNAEFMKAMEYSLKRASQLQDLEWIYNLKIFLDRGKIKENDFKDYNLYGMLKDFDL